MINTLFFNDLYQIKIFVNVWIFLLKALLKYNFTFEKI